MPLSTLPPAPVEETGRGAGQLITIRVQAPDDEDQEDREEEEDICRISVTQWWLDNKTHTTFLVSDCGWFITSSQVRAVWLGIIGIIEYQPLLGFITREPRWVHVSIHVCTRVHWGCYIMVTHGISIYSYLSALERLAHFWRCTNKYANVGWQSALRVRAGTSSVICMQFVQKHAGDNIPSLFSQKRVKHWYEFSD